MAALGPGHCSGSGRTPGSGFAPPEVPRDVWNQLRCSEHGANNARLSSLHGPFTRQLDPMMLEGRFQAGMFWDSVPSRPARGRRCLRSPLGFGLPPAPPCAHPAGQGCFQQRGRLARPSSPLRGENWLCNLSEFLLSDGRENLQVPPSLLFIKYSGGRSPGLESSRRPSLCCPGALAAAATPVWGTPWEPEVASPPLCCCCCCWGSPGSSVRDPRLEVSDSRSPRAPGIPGREIRRDPTGGGSRESCGHGGALGARCRCRCRCRQPGRSAVLPALGLGQGFWGRGRLSGLCSPFSPFSLRGGAAVRGRARSGRCSPGKELASPRCPWLAPPGQPRSIGGSAGRGAAVWGLCVTSVLRARVLAWPRGEWRVSQPCHRHSPRGCGTTLR